jgi:hypothetical protein
MALKPELIRGDELTLDTFVTHLKTNVPATASFTVDGVVYTHADLVKKVEEARQPFKAVRLLATELKRERAELAAKRDEIRVLVHALHTAAKAFVRETNPEIVKFGFRPDRKHRPLTAEESAARVAKMRATREANHTMGSRQKKELKAKAESGSRDPGTANPAH